MREYAAAVPCSSTFFVSVVNAREQSLFDHFADVILRSMERETILETTPAEMRVLDSFSDWLESIADKDLKNPPDNPFFYYSNLTTGAMLLFIANFGSAASFDSYSISIGCKSFGMKTRSVRRKSRLARKAGQIH
jgi:hypothetical protein